MDVKIQNKEQSQNDVHRYEMHFPSKFIFTTILVQIKNIRHQHDTYLNGNLGLFTELSAIN